MERRFNILRQILPFHHGKKSLYPNYYFVVPEKFNLRKRGSCFRKKPTIRFSTPAKFEPINCKQKESPNELSHIKPAARQDRVDSITLFAFEMVALQLVIRFQVSKDRLDR